MAHFSDYVTAEIKEQAARSIEQLADRYLSSEWPHKTRKGRECNYGRTKGSRSWTANLSGPHAGTVRHWSEDRSYDAIALVREFEHCSYPEALASLAAFLGIHVDTAPIDREQQEARRKEAERRAAQAKAKRDKEQHREDSAARVRVLSHVSNCAPAEGTPAERYLTEHRGLTIPGTGWPDSIRWHERSACLSAILTNEAGEPLTVQRISLTRNTAARRKGADGKTEPKKLMKGARRAGAYVRLAALADTSLPDTLRKPLILAEGPETALSLWQATGAETWATIGANDKVTVPGSRLVILARDDDKIGSQADETADKLKAALQGAGHIVVDCWPHAERKGDKSDFNDLLKQEGEAAVLARVLAALQLAPKPLPPIGKARGMVRELAEGFVSSHIGQETPEGTAPPALLLPVGVGIGKSRGAMLAAISNYDPEKGPIAYAVPNHDLAAQAAADLQKLAPHLRVRPWRGREQPGMCRNVDDRRTVERAGLSVMKTLCRKKGACPFAQDCPYLQQCDAQADMWVVPHNLLFIGKPETIPALSLLIIDENFSSAGLKGFDGPGKGRPIASIRFPEKYRKTHKHHTAQHTENRASRLRDALELTAQRDGAYLSKSDLAALNFTAENLKEAREETSEAMRWLAQDGESIEKIREWAPVLSFARSLCGLYAEAERLMRSDAEETGRLTVKQTPNGPAYKLTGISQIAPGWAVPTLMLDATANPQTVRAFFPDVEIAEAIQAEAPYAQFIHAPRQRWGKRAQSEAVSQHMNEGSRGLAGCSIEAIRVGMWSRAIETDGTSLTICNKETRYYLEGKKRDKGGEWVDVPDHEKPFLPPGAKLAHFGNLVGLNAFEEVASLDIYGRPLPNVQELERKAETMLGVPLQQKAERLEWVAMERTTRAGDTVQSGRYRHPDPFADALLQEMLDGQLIQAVGRARAVNRGADNPVIIRVNAETYPATLPLDYVEEHGGPSALARQMAGERGAMPALMSAGDAATCYPDLWRTAEAAKKALQRQKPQKIAGSSDFVPKGTKPFNNILKEKCPFGYKLSAGRGKLPMLRLRSVAYRPKGSSEKWRGALVPPDMADQTFRDWLQDRLRVPMELQGEAATRTGLDVFEHELDVIAPAKGNEPAQPQSIIGGALSRAGPIPDKVGLARSLAWVYLTDALNTDPSERRAILSSEQAQRIAGRLSYRGDVTDGLAWLAGLKDEMGMEYSGGLEAMSGLRPALPEPSGNIK